MPPLKQLLIRAGLVAAFTIVGLMISELLLRAAGYHYTPLRIDVQYKSDWRDYHVFEDTSFVSDSYLIWRPKASAAVFNSQGYRGRELEADKKPGSIRIFTVGDSNTLGWGEQNGPNWPLYLDELLQRADSRTTVVNAGVWGYSSFQGRRRFEEVLRFQPDIVFISFGSNDAHRVTISDSDFVNLGGRKLTFYLGRMLNTLRIGQLLLAASDKAFLKEKEQLVARVSLQEYKANLNEIVQEAMRRNIQVVLLTRPYIGKSSDERWWMTYEPDYNAAVEEIANSANVPWIDVYSRFRDRKEYFADESHFNEVGHRLMAQVVYEKIRPILDERRAPQ
jgi:lysophospholipase L1-like esterase